MDIGNVPVALLYLRKGPGFRSAAEFPAKQGVSEEQRREIEEKRQKALARRAEAEKAKASLPFRLFSLVGVENVFLGADFISVTKAEDI